MSKQHYDLLVFICRAQPFHLGHKRVIELALEQADKVLVLIGSSFKARDIKNPFTYNERKMMIECSMEPTEISRIVIRPLRDHVQNNMWISEVQQHVDLFIPKGKSSSIGIIGYEKDSSSFYLKMFTQWDFIDVGRSYIETIDATTIRNMWLSGQSPNFTEGVLRDSVHTFIYKKFPKKEYERLVNEFNIINNYKKQWANTPYPVIFQTVDAVIMCSGHVLLVRRKTAPGQNLLACVGGFVNSDETIEESLFREIKEETNLKVPVPVLRGSIKAQKTFDTVGRSLRGRTITTAFLIELNDTKLPKVKGGDDAAKAIWMSFNDINKHEEEFFEDHKQIIDWALGKA